MGNVRLPRRQFLALGAASLVGTLLAGCDRLSEAPDFEEFLASAEWLTYRVQRLLGRGHARAREFTASDVSPVFKVNGTSMPEGEDYAALREGNFADWRLRVDGLVASLSICRLRICGTCRSGPRSPAMTASKGGAPSANGKAFRWLLCSRGPRFSPPRGSSSSTAPMFTNKRLTAQGSITKASI